MSYNEIEGAEIVLGIWVKFFNPEFQKIDNICTEIENIHMKQKGI